MTERICLLTGASGLLGTAFIERFTAHYKIAAVCNRNLVEFATQEQAFVDPLCPSEEIAANRRAVFSIMADLSKPHEIDRVIDQVIDRFGRVDLLINGAAVRKYSHLLAPGALDGAEMLFSVNLLAAVRLGVGLAERLWRLDPDENLQFNRNIINISSTAGLFMYPDLGQSLYGTSKAALNHLTYHLANEFWDLGVRVNSIAPDTFPGRIPTEEVLEAILVLDTSNQTGQVVRLYREA
jgi:NAD(P)-dependent dehydrogenase (short-subunit alcohol dehydrogenase family)